MLTVNRIKTIMRRRRNLSKGILNIDPDAKVIRMYSRIRGNEWNISFAEFELTNNG